MAVLRGMSGDAKGQVFELIDGETTVGRHEGNKIMLGDASVSSFHCCIIKDGGKYTLRDLDSTNGTRVNGQPITVRRLEPGVIIRIGAVELMFEGEDVETEGIQTPAALPRVEAVEAEDSGIAEENAAASGHVFKPIARYKGKGIWIMMGIVGALAVLGILILFVTLLRLE